MCGYGLAKCHIEMGAYLTSALSMDHLPFPPTLLYSLCCLADQPRLSATPYVLSLT